MDSKPTLSAKIEQRQGIPTTYGENPLLVIALQFEYLSEDSDFKRVLKKDPDIFPIYTSQDPYQDINSGSMNLLKGILEKGIKENRFRNVNVELVTRLMFSIYKMFIIEAYVLGEESSKLMFDELIRLIAEGLFMRR